MVEKIDGQLSEFLDLNQSHYSDEFQKMVLGKDVADCNGSVFAKVDDILVSKQSHSAKYLMLAVRHGMWGSQQEMIIYPVSGIRVIGAEQISINDNMRQLMESAEFSPWLVQQREKYKLASVRYDLDFSMASGD